MIEFIIVLFYIEKKEEDVLPKTRQRQSHILPLTFIDSYFLKCTYSVIYINAYRNLIHIRICTFYLGRCGDNDTKCK